MPSSSSSFVRCRNCGHGVYRGALRCPHCHRRMRWNWKPLALWALAILLGLGLVLIWLTVDFQPPPTPLFENR